MRIKSLALIVALDVLSGVVSAQNALDWPQWRGPNRDGSLASFGTPQGTSYPV